MTTGSAPIEYTFCRLCPAQLDKAAEIERHAPDPWTADQILEELGSDAALCLGALDGGRLVCIAFFQTAADEATLNTVTTAPAQRGKGAAQALLTHGFSLLNERGASTVYLEVRGQNQPALALYRKLGFEQVGLRRGFYKNPPDDAVVMSRPL